jgi:hypothetical protein
MRNNRGPSRWCVGKKKKELKDQGCAYGESLSILGNNKQPRGKMSGKLRVRPGLRARRIEWWRRLGKEGR